MTDRPEPLLMDLRDAETEALITRFTSTFFEGISTANRVSGIGDMQRRRDGKVRDVVLYHEDHLIYSTNCEETK